MRVLWISPRWSLPPDSGAKLATMTLLSELVPAAQGNNISLQLDLLFLCETEEQKQEGAALARAVQAQKYFIVSKRPLLRDSNALTYVAERLRHPTLPYTVARCALDAEVSGFEHWQEERQWDYTIIDGVHAAMMIDTQHPRYGQLVYRAHNVEADLWKQLIDKETSFLKRQAVRLEYVLAKKFEDKVCAHSRWVVPVSELDAQRFREFLPSEKVQALPIGISFAGKPLAFPALPAGAPLQLLFVGRLDWLPNKEGLLWLLREVWPYLQRPSSLQLTIVGSGDSDWLRPYASANVQILGRVDDLRTHYERSHITLIPLFMGSGTRVKAIEAGSFGRSFISTAIGVEGLPFEPGQEYVRAENKEEWLRILNELSFAQAQEKSAKVFQAASQNFNQALLAEKFIRLISKHV